MQTKLNDGSVMICGFIANNSEMKTTQNGKKYCRWSVKVGNRKNADGNDEAVWVNCQAWGDVAKTSSRITKGDVVFCVGRIDTSEYLGKTYKTLVCEFVSIMDKSQNVQPQNPETINPDINIDEFEEILGDEPPF